jgi:hypothetical protein
MFIMTVQLEIVRATARGRRKIAKETELYRHYDEEGNLLYVGISLSAVHRLSEHKRDSGWFGRIAYVKIERFKTRKAALVAEQVAIITEAPLWNQQHNNGSLRREYDEQPYEVASDYRHALRSSLQEAPKADSKPYLTRKCVECGEEFLTRQPQKKFCDQTCNGRYHWKRREERSIKIAA